MPTADSGRAPLTRRHSPTVERHVGAQALVPVPRVTAPSATADPLTRGDLARADEKHARGGGDRGSASRIGGGEESRPAGFLLGYGILAAVSVLTSLPGRYVTDNRFGWYWEPSDLVRRLGSIWDARRSFGGPISEFFPGFALLPAGVRALGVSPALTERVVQATLLVVAGFGVLMLARLFVPDRRLAPGLAGLVYMFSPYTATFLVPSSLFVNYAVAPWLVYAFVRGVRDGSRWRSPAAFALVIFAAGLSNPPGLLWAALPLAPTALYLVVVDRSARWRDVLVWSARAGTLTVLVLAVGLLKVSQQTAYVSTNLGSTESVKAVSLASSWGESWRGMGFWLTYFGDAGGSFTQKLAEYFSSPALVLATFVLPVTALVVIWQSRWRGRLLFAGISVLALVAMVGVFPISDPSPSGRLLRFGYEQIGGLFALRNTYKAGAGLQMGTAVLAGVGVAAVISASRRRWQRVVIAVLFVGVVGWTSYPFWTGQLYGNAETQVTDIPVYYEQAFSWLEHQPGDGRVLVLPGATSTAYRWGGIGPDDIFDGVSRRPFVKAEFFATEGANDVIAALDERIRSGTYEPGMLGPIARRLGIEYVLIRNDLAWESIQRPRPSALEVVRTDPDLVLAATFGGPGTNTSAVSDLSVAARADRRLPPVEVYRVRDPQPPLRVLEPGPSLLVAGDGAAWPLLAQRGVLTNSGPLRYTGSLTSPGLRTELAKGAPVVVTDTNRRRFLTASGAGVSSSPTLTAQETPERGLRDVFRRRGSQSVATYGDVIAITAKESGFGSEVANRPAAAFDGDPTTAWLTGSFDPHPSGSLKARLRHAATVSKITVLTARLFGAPRGVTGAVLRLSDGSEFPLRFVGGRAVARFSPRRITSAAVEFTEVTGTGVTPVGLAEVMIQGVNTRETVRVPDDIFRLARRAHGDALLARAPLSYQFQLEGAEESVMRRSFPTVGERSFSVAGHLVLDANTPEAVVDQIVGTDRGAVGSDRYGDDLRNAGVAAVDGDPLTAWRARPTPGVRLDVRLPPTSVRRVSVRTDGGGQFSRITEMRITAGDESVTAVPEATDGCAAEHAAAEASCSFAVDVAVPRATIGSLRIEATGFELRPDGAGGSKPVEVSEVFVNGAPNPARDYGVVPSSCADGLMRVDGQTVGLSIDGQLDTLLAQSPVPFTACSPLELSAGQHKLVTTVRVDDAVLDDGRALPMAPRVRGRRIVSEGDAGTVVRLRPGRATIVSGSSYNPNWQASAGDHSLGTPVSLDTQAGWIDAKVPANVLELRFGTQPLFEVLGAVSVVAVVFCLVVLVWPRRRRK